MALDAVVFLREGASRGPQDRTDSAADDISTGCRVGVSSRSEMIEDEPHRTGGVDSAEIRPGAPESPGRDIGEVSPRCATTVIPLADAARRVREAMRDKSYRGTPLGEHVGAFMRYTLNQDWEQRSRAEYESTLYRFALYFADLDLPDFTPPVGIERMESSSRPPGEAPPAELVPRTSRFSRASSAGPTSGTASLATRCSPSSAHAGASPTVADRRTSRRRSTPSFGLSTTSATVPPCS